MAKGLLIREGKLVIRDGKLIIKDSAEPCECCEETAPCDCITTSQGLTFTIVSTCANLFSQSFGLAYESGVWEGEPENGGCESELNPYTVEVWCEDDEWWVWIQGFENFYLATLTLVSCEPFALEVEDVLIGDGNFLCYCGGIDDTFSIYITE